MNINRLNEILGALTELQKKIEAINNRTLDTSELEKAVVNLYGEVKALNTNYYSVLGELKNVKGMFDVAVSDEARSEFVTEMKALQQQYGELTKFMSDNDAILNRPQGASVPVSPAPQVNPVPVQIPQEKPQPSLRELTQSIETEQYVAPKVEIPAAAPVPAKQPVASLSPRQMAQMTKPVVDVKPDYNRMVQTRANMQADAEAERYDETEVGMIEEPYDETPYDVDLPEDHVNEVEINIIESEDYDNFLREQMAMEAAAAAEAEQFESEGFEPTEEYLSEDDIPEGEIIADDDAGYTEPEMDSITDEFVNGTPANEYEIEDLENPAQDMSYSEKLKADAENRKAKARRARKAMEEETSDVMAGDMNISKMVDDTISKNYKHHDK